MMKAIVAMNAFKGSIRARAATDAVALAFEQAGFEVERLYLADGGEGTIEAAAAMGARVEFVPTMDPLMRPIEAPIAWLGQTAVIELARASGMGLIAPEERNPMLTTTWGTGVLVRRAVEQRATTIILGVGGSATLDGGLGMLAAMGFSVTDDAGNDTWRGGEGLTRTTRIVGSGAGRPPSLVLATDVINPLTGPTGAAAVFGPQKGGTADMVSSIEKGMENLARLTAQVTGVHLESMPGAGAAGGLAGTAVAWLGARTQPGAELFMELQDFDRRAAGAVVLVTGEGRIDAQTVYGKVPVRVARRFRSVSPGGLVVALAGAVRDRAAVHDAGIDILLATPDAPMSEQDAMANALPLLEQTAAEVARLLASRG
ncbi:MAG: glycerate kinase [Armatimonadia bacterium]